MPHIVCQKTGFIDSDHVNFDFHPDPATKALDTNFNKPWWELSLFISVVWH